MWYTQVYTPPVRQPAAVPIVRAVTQPPLPMRAVHRTTEPSTAVGSEDLLNRPMNAAYAGRADLALAHFAKILGVKLVLDAQVRSMVVALFGQGTVGSFLGQVCQQLPADIHVTLDLKTHTMVVSRG